MSAKEKAKELIRKFYSIGANECEKCAIIAVDEVIKSHHNLYGVNNKEVKFYLEVKQEIEKL